VLLSAPQVEVESKGAAIGGAWRENVPDKSGTSISIILTDIHAE
jgi:hypothetical protein